MRDVFQDDYHATPVTKVTEPFLDEKKISLYIKRDDLIDPEIQGNKYRKLKYNFLHLKENKLNSLLTFGGAFSNHIHATAAAGARFGMRTIGIIRAEDADPDNSTLRYARDKGMELYFISRQDYKNRHDTKYQEELKYNYNADFIVPEGGTNHYAIKGAEEILKEVELLPDIIASPVGTGGTAAGLINSMSADSEFIGFSALKGGSFLMDEMRPWIKKERNWTIETRFHCGGYGKTPVYLLDFILEFYLKHEIWLDPIYTGKMMFGLYQMILKEDIPSNKKLLAIHTGGLQGWQGVLSRINHWPKSQRPEHIGLAYEKFY